MPDTLIKSGRIARWGNSAAVRLAAATLEHAGLRMDDPVEVVAREDEVVIRRERPRVTMDELLARFDPKRHCRELELDVEPTGTETRE